MALDPVSLEDFLATFTARRWVWGESDCVSFGLAWARARSGKPLAAFFDYRSRKEAQAALAARGGLERVVTAWMAWNGFPLIAKPDDGDIGLAPVPGEGPESVAPVAIVIRRGPWWISREPRGFGVVNTESISAWRVA